MKTFAIYYISASIVIFVLTTFATCVAWAKYKRENEIVKVVSKHETLAERVLATIKAVILCLTPLFRYVVLYTCLFSEETMENAFDEKVDNAESVIYTYPVEEDEED